MLKRAARARGEHGLALLLTLCILSMTLITAMIFSSNASTGRKVASSYVDSSAARILADGIVNRAVMALMQSENTYVCSNYKVNNPNSVGGANDYSSDWIWKLEKPGLFEFNRGPLRFRGSYYDRDDTRCPSWEYVFNKSTYGDSSKNTERIFGRYAYVAIGMNDQLNPNAIGNRDKVDNSLLEKRLGYYTCEPRFVFKSTINNWNYSSQITPEKIKANYNGPTGWTDIDLFIDEMTSGGDDPRTNQLKMMVDQYFDLSGEKEYNKYRPDGKVIGDLTSLQRDNGEEYRFPIIRTDWDSINFNTVKNAIPWFNNAASSMQTAANQTVANLINYNASVNRPPVTDNDNWTSGEPTYTGNKRTPYINEVQGDIAVDGSLGVRLAERYLADPNNPSSWLWRVWYTDCSYSHQITISVETVNMYENPIAVRAPLLVGEISYEYWNPNGDGAGFWVPQTVRFDPGTRWTTVDSSKGSDAGYKVYTFILDNNAVGSMTTPRRDGYERPMGHEGDFYEHLKIRNIKVNVDRVILLDNAGRNADLALMPQLLQTGRTVLNKELSALDNGFGQHYYFDTQVNDPRCNLARTEWSNPLFTAADNVEVLGKNAAVKPGTNHDNEDKSNYDPAYNAGSDHISTAYIRHDPMQSLWELGAIHRGSAWQTINLKCATKNGTKMEAYQNGDGHLLDQVALASSTDRASDAVLGLINLNCVASFGGSSAPFVFKSLFTDFPIYKTYAAMNSGSAGGTIRGESVDSDKTGDMDADSYAKDLSEAVTYATSQGNLPRRTAVFPTAYPSTGNQMEHIIKKNVPDAEAEEIFCRVVNLLKWNKQPLKRATVLVLAQTIKDVGGATLTRRLPENDEDVWHDFGFQSFSIDTGTSKMTSDSTLDIATLRSNYASRSVALKQYDNSYDQITGESKIIVRLEWDESANDNKGAWKVTRKEYAE